MQHGAARTRLVAWIQGSRLRSFFVCFPMSTLTCYLVQYFFVRFGERNLGWRFPLLFGLGMGITYAFFLRSPHLAGQNSKKE